MTNFDRQRAEQYLNQPLPELMDELALYDDTYRGASDVWERVAAPLRQYICSEGWDWCKKRQDARFENKLDLAVAVGIALSEQSFQTSLDVENILLAVIAVKIGLDSFCDCPKPS